MNPTLVFDEKENKYVLNMAREPSSDAAPPATMAQDRGGQIIWDESIGKWVIDTPSTKPAVTESVAPMEASGMAASIEKIGKMEVMGVPIGGVMLGTGLAFVIDKILVDRLIASQIKDEKDTTKAAEKAATISMISDLALAGVIAKFGPKYIGQSAAKYAAFVLCYEAVSGRISEWLDRIWPKAKENKTTQSQLQQDSQPMMQPPMNQIYGGGWSDRHIMQQTASVKNTGGNLGIYEGAF